MDNYAQLVADFAREIFRNDTAPNGHAGSPAANGETPAPPYEALRNSPEYREVIRPLAARIESLYATYVFRQPTTQEVANHIHTFRAWFGGLDEERAFLRDHDVRSRLGFRPLDVIMDITNQCNLRCVMCHFSDKLFAKQKRQDLSVEDYARIADQLFPLSHRLALSCRTEPLLHHHFADLVALAKSYGVPNVYAITNGQLLTEQVIDRIIASGLDELVVSVDGETKETYERIRTGAKFERLIANIQALNRAKDRLKSATPRLGFSAVLLRSNITELPGIVRLARELRIEYIGANHLLRHDLQNVSGESLVGHGALYDRLADEARALAEEFGILIFLPKPFAERSPERGPFEATGPAHARSQCPYPWQIILLTPTGNVLTCHWLFSEPPMGNLLSEPFEAIWNNARYRQLRAEHVSGAVRHDCRNCHISGLSALDDQAFLVVELKKNLDVLTQWYPTIGLRKQRD